MKWLVTKKCSSPDRSRNYGTEKSYLKKNSGKYNFTDQTIKNPKDKKRQKEDKESSNSYGIEAVEFLHNINFENGDFDDNVIDHIVESNVYTVVMLHIKLKRSFLWIRIQFQGAIIVHRFLIFKY